MAEWRWEQEDAAIIQKIMRGFLIRKEQKVTFKKVTTEGCEAPGVGGASPPEWDEGFGNVDEIWTMMTQESCSWERWASEEIQRIYRGYVQRKWWSGIRIKDGPKPVVSPPEDTDEESDEEWGYRHCGCRNCNL